MTPETLAHVTATVATHGSDCWWDLPIADLLPPSERHRGAFSRPNPPAPSPSSRPSPSCCPPAALSMVWG